MGKDFDFNPMTHVLLLRCRSSRCARSVLLLLAHCAKAWQVDGSWYTKPLLPLSAFELSLWVEPRCGRFFHCGTCATHCALSALQRGGESGKGPCILGWWCVMLPCSGLRHSQQQLQCGTVLQGTACTRASGRHACSLKARCCSKKRLAQGTPCRQHADSTLQPLRQGLTVRRCMVT